MIVRAALAAALALAGAAAEARAQGAPSVRLGIDAKGAPEPVDLVADSISYSWDRNILYLEGHLVVTRGEGVLRAARGVLDRAANTLRLEGGVLAVQGRDVALADSAVLDLTSRSADLAGAVVYLKADAPPQLRTLTDAKAARGLGRNALTLHATRVERTREGQLIAREVTLTPCDCAGSPDYEIASREARVGEDRVALASPRLRIGGVSIPLFPLSLPLGDRQSGLLFPRFGFSSATGLALSLPVFETLGRSYDATIAPGIFTGNPGTGTSALNQRSVKGPRLGLELRYAPAVGTDGEVGLNLFQDLDRNDPLPPGGSTQTLGEPNPSPGRGLPFANGLRGVLRFSHRTQQGKFVVAAQGILASDTMVLADAEPTQIERYLGSLPTDVGAWAASGPLAAGLDATALQDVRIDNFAFPDRRLFGSEARPVPGRLPAVFAQIAPLALGPFALSAEASAARFQALNGPTLLERDTGYGPTDSGTNGAALVPTADPQGLARGRVVRLDATERLSAALPAGLPLWARAELGARADAWLFENDSVRDTRRVYGLAGAAAGVSLSRAYGDLLHTIAPAVEVRVLSRALRSGGPPIGDPSDAGGATYSSNPDAALQGLAPGIAAPAANGVIPGGATLGVPAARRAYDEVDSAAPEQGAGEASLRILQSLWKRTAPGRAPWQVASLELRQDFVFWLGGGHGRAGEASGATTVASGPFALQALARYDWEQRTITTASAGSNLHDARGDDVHASLLYLNGSAGSRIRAGIDELFAAVRLARLDPLRTVSAGGLSFGTTWLLPFAHDALRFGADATRHIGPLNPFDGVPDWLLHAQLTLETPCHCAGFLIAADVPLRNGRLLNGPTVRVLIDLKSLGSLSTF